MRDILFISGSPVAQDEFVHQIRVVQPGRRVVPCDQAEALRGGAFEGGAIFLDCRGGHAFGETALREIRSWQSPVAPFVIGIIDNTETAKAWAVKAGLDDALLSPFSLLDLHLRTMNMHGALAQREEIARLQRTAAEVESEASRFRALAYTDHLTGLPNRLALEEWASGVIASQEEKSFAFQMLDLNGFKQVNDRHGHHVGDLLLKQVGARVAGISRRLDLVARLGGDEIAIIQVGALTREDCSALAGRLLAAFQEPFKVGELEITMSASIGSALYPHDAARLDDLMRRADSAMYAAKAHGPGSFVSFPAPVRPVSA